MSTFEFVAVILSIVVGLGFTRLLSALSSLIEHRASVRPDAVTLVWVAYLLQLHVVFWWVVVGNARQIEDWFIGDFLALLAYAVALYFAASLILPTSPAEGGDLRERFQTIRRPFFTMLATIIALELLDTILKGGLDRLLAFGFPYTVMTGGTLAGAVACLWVSDRRFHLLFASFAFLTTLAWNLSSFSYL